jgi:hypothetical protein
MEPPVLARAVTPGEVDGQVPPDGYHLVTAVLQPITVQVILIFAPKPPSGELPA